MNLRKYAKGKPCQIRVPNHCNGNPETSVWCHVRIIGISGAGLKAPDLLGAIGCSACHDVVDGRTKSKFSYEERRLLLLEGVARTQAELIEEGRVNW